MGLYRTVHTAIPCARCGTDRDVEIQFKTDDEIDLPEYEVGDIATDVDEGTYEGSYDAYCAECAGRWSAERHRVAMSALAERVMAGELVLRAAGTVLPADMVRKLAPVSDEYAGFPTEMLLGMASVEVWQGDVRRCPYEPLEDEDTYAFWRHHDAAVDALMRASGWRHGEAEYGTIAVLVDADHRVRLGDY